MKTLTCPKGKGPEVFFAELSRTMSFRTIDRLAVTIEPFREDQLNQLHQLLREVGETLEPFGLEVVTYEDFWTIRTKEDVAVKCKIVPFKDAGDLYDPV